MRLNYGSDLCMHCTCANWVLTLKKITFIKESFVFSFKKERKVTCKRFFGLTLLGF